MDLAAQYRGLYQAALFTAECAEDAYPLGALDSTLKPWFRRRLESREHSLDHCDSRMDLASAVEDLAGIAPHYVELRRDLFGDLHHIGRPAPTWRAVDSTLAVWAPLQVWRQPPACALLLRDSGVASGGAQTWDFIVFGRSGDPRDQGKVYTAMLFPDADAGAGTGGRTVQVAGHLEDQRELYEQLTYAFQSLWHNVRFAALHDPDRGRNLPPADA
ncbi:hypothetical protein ACFZBU_38200 [Embleya sp. NPDC008237]|uniref:hypothetical protein n=1 Tax=Embleya sp. NPDC008237 TaxID=3363978 RepID=UPI0036F0017F